MEQARSAGRGSDDAPRAQLSLRLDIAIRRCRRTDLEALEWWGLYTEHRAIIQAAYDRQKMGEVIMLVADLNGFPIGQTWIDFRPSQHVGTGSLENGRSASLWAVRVLPPLRGLGIGAHLIHAAETRIREAGRVEAVLTVERDNPGARRFYERLGYRTAGDARGEYRYRNPDGHLRRIPLNQWIMRKALCGSLRAD